MRTYGFSLHQVTQAEPWEQRFSCGISCLEMKESVTMFMIYNLGDLGPEYSDSEIKQYLEERSYPYKFIGNGSASSTIADLIEEGKVVGWFNGRMEFGPRALGGRL